MKAHLSYIISLAACLCLFSTSMANPITINVEGEWHGYTRFLGKEYPLTLKLQQDGLHVEGEVFSENLQQTQFIKYTVNGLIEDNKITLKGIDIIDRKGSFGCLATIIVTMVQSDQELTLSGKWKSNFVKGGCLAGASGVFFAVKEVNSPVLVNAIAEYDKEGEVLVHSLEKRKFYALLIAVDDYDHPDIVDLENTISDAENLWNVLSANYTFESTDRIFLKNPTRKDILDTFTELSARLGETDQLLIYFGGHGVWDEQLTQGYWLPSDAQKESKADWISNSTIKDYVRSFKTKHTLLVADACFSGGLFKERDAFAYGKAMLEMYKLPSRKAITSGALTTVPDKSVFMKYLTAGLANNEDPLFNAEQLFYNLKLSVINNSPNGQVPQYGVIRETDDQGGAFIFLRR